jgi:hypothetical protein
VDLVEEEDRARPRGAEPLASAGDCLPNVLDRRRDGGELLELGARLVGDDPRQGRLAASRRAVEDHRAGAILLDRQPERRALPQDLLLADEVVEPLRAKSQRERRDVGQPLVGRV